MKPGAEFHHGGVPEKAEHVEIEKGGTGGQDEIGGGGDSVAPRGGQGLNLLEVLHHKVQRHGSDLGGVGQVQLPQVRGVGHHLEGVVVLKAVAVPRNVQPFERRLK